jgi:hypothetical protein
MKRLKELSVLKLEEVSIGREVIILNGRIAGL